MYDLEKHEELMCKELVDVISKLLKYKKKPSLADIGYGYKVVSIYECGMLIVILPRTGHYSDGVTIIVYSLRTIIKLISFRVIYDELVDNIKYNGEKVLGILSVIEQLRNKVEQLDNIANISIDSGYIFAMDPADGKDKTIVALWTHDLFEAWKMLEQKGIDMDRPILGHIDEVCK